MKAAHSSGVKISKDLAGPSSHGPRSPGCRSLAGPPSRRPRRSYRSPRCGCSCARPRGPGRIRPLPRLLSRSLNAIRRSVDHGLRILRPQGQAPQPAQRQALDLALAPGSAGQNAQTRTRVTRPGLLDRARPRTISQNRRTTRQQARAVRAPDRIPARPARTRLPDRPPRRRPAPPAHRGTPHARRDTPTP